jgi:taurine dioxygenase
MVMTSTRISVEKLGASLGAEVRGVDISQPVPDDVFQQITDAWLEHLVLVFPDQALSNEQHIAFSRRFGTLEVHPSRKHNVKDYPELLLLTNRKDAQGNYVSLRDGGSIWHSDLSYMAEPSRCSLLYAIDVPDEGGDTEWANMYRAYEALPQNLKDRIAGLRAVHQFDLVDNPRFGPPAHMTAADLKGSIWEPKSAAVKARTPDAVHPIVRTHPITGRKALFVSRRFTVRVADTHPDEGESLLLELFDYAERPEHIYHHRWSKHQLLLWDNRCTVHLACGGVPDSQIRTMQRTTVRGEIPV